MSLRVVLASVLLLLTLTRSSVHAQDASVTERRDAEARGLFEAGRAAFTDGRFEDAREYFRRAYELSGRAALLYNVGTAADRLRDDDAALAAFEGYLEGVPDAENATEVRARIEQLRESIARREALGATPMPAATEPSRGPPIPIVGIVLGGLALATGGAAIGTWVAANDAYAARESGCFALRGGCTSDELSGVDALVVTTNVLLITSLLIGAGAITVLVVELTSGSSGEAASRARLSPWGLTVEGSF